MGRPLLTGAFKAFSSPDGSSINNVSLSCDSLHLLPSSFTKVIWLLAGDVHYDANSKVLGTRMIFPCHVACPKTVQPYTQWFLMAASPVAPLLLIKSGRDLMANYQSVITWRTVDISSGRPFKVYWKITHCLLKQLARTMDISSVCKESDIIVHPQGGEKHSGRLETYGSGTNRFCITTKTEQNSEMETKKSRRQEMWRIILGNELT